MWKHTFWDLLIVDLSLLAILDPLNTLKIRVSQMLYLHEGDFSPIEEGRSTSDYEWTGSGDNTFWGGDLA